MTNDPSRSLKCRRAGVFLLALAGLLTAGVPQGSAEPVELTAATIEDLNRAFDSGALTAVSLVEMFIARVEAFDDVGPKLNAVMTLNPAALTRAKALDEERKAGRTRSRLHGIPIVLKDNFDTADMPTTAGSFLLEDSMPPDDAFVVQKLRRAGAIILAKVNMSEFASGAAMSSLGGFSLNPHDLTRSPSGSSGGTGVAVRQRRSRDRHRRLGTRAVDRERYRRPETDPRTPESRRDHPAGAIVRYRGPDGPERL